MLCGGFVKLSLLSLYLHLSPWGWFRVAVWASITIVTFFTGAITFVMFFNCSPVNRAFNSRVEVGSCIDPTILHITTAVFVVVTDVMLFILPIPMVYQLQLQNHQKVGATIVFGLGSATITTSVVRLVQLPAVISSDDPSWTSAPANVWTYVLHDIAIIAKIKTLLTKQLSRE